MRCGPTLSTPNTIAGPAAARPGRRNRLFRAGCCLSVILAPGLVTAQTTRPAEYTGTPVAVCEVADRRIVEASGICASRVNPGCYYIHNDSGDMPRVFLIDRTGRIRLEIRLKAASAVDYEDIAIAPGPRPGTFDVCVADIGDNDAKRKEVVIYRFPEIELKPGQPDPLEVHPAAYRLRYADGPADAEAFCVHPRTGDGYVVSKRMDGTGRVYKLSAPWNADQIATLARLTTVELPRAIPPGQIITAADISPDGRRLAVRCYVDGWEWRLPSGRSDGEFDAIFGTRPIPLQLPAEQQGEALGYAADGQALLTISEGKRPTLYEVPLQPPTNRP